MRGGGSNEGHWWFIREKGECEKDGQKWEKGGGESERTQVNGKK